MFDLALSPNGDLILAGNRDLAGISGADLVEQRIRLRLRLRRGTWVYDENETLGSQLHRMIGMAPEEAHNSVGAYVREALRTMDDINVDDVLHFHVNAEGEVGDVHDPNENIAVEVLVLYTIISDDENTTEDISEQRELRVSIPIGGGI